MTRSGLAIFLLGGVRIELDSSPVTGLASRKAEALLIYLAYEQQVKSREFLAGMLWPDSSQARGLANLSVVLTSLRKQLDPFLHTTHQTIAFVHDRDYTLDVADFERDIGNARRLQQQQGQITRAAAALLISATEAYRGDFLAGFSIRQAPDFEAWALLEQERLRRLALESMHDLGNFYMGRGQFTTGIEQVNRLLALDPLREDGHRLLMRLLALDGQRASALAQFDRCFEVLRDELGVEPDDETAALYEAIAKDEFPSGQGVREAAPAIAAGQVPVAPSHNLPHIPTPFVGRELEQSQIAARLDSLDCRLLTLTGPGGIGKTRLALQAAGQRLATYRDGVWFVGLAALDDAAGIPSAIASAMGFAFSGPADPANQLVDFLRNKETLLLLDNFEQLIGDQSLDLVARLLAEAPGTQMLVTSRERLNLQAEWIVDVSGLPYPADSADPRAGHYAAVRLLVQHAQRLRTDFKLDATNQAAVVRICQMVDGMPLALELAASWIRALAPQEIVAELARGLEVLTTTARDLPARHRSIRAVFDYSWQSLSQPQQVALMQLSVFRGGFTRETAAAVAGVTAGVLLALVDKSLVRPLASGRFLKHVLTNQYAESRLAEHPQLERQVHADHARYFAERLQRQEHGFYGSDDRNALGWMVAEEENIRRAWRWAVAEQDLTLVGHFLESFLYFFDIQGRYREGAELTQEALAALAPIDGESEPRFRRVLGRLTALDGGFRFRLGDFEGTRLQAERAVALLEPFRPLLDLGHAFLYRGIGFYGLGDLDRCLADSLRARDAYREAGHAWGEGAALDNAGTILSLQGHHDEGRRLHLEALEIAQKLGSRYLMAALLGDLANIETAAGDHDKALDYAERSLAVIEEMERPYMTATISRALGDIALQSGDYSAAEEHLAKALAIARNTGNRLDLADALVQLGAVHMAQKRYELATEAYQEAVATAGDIQARLMVADALAGLGEVAMHRGAPHKAVTLLAFVVTNGVSRAETCQKAEALLQEASTLLSRDAYQNAEKRGQALTSDAAIALVSRYT